MAVVWVGITSFARQDSIKHFGWNLTLNVGIAPWPRVVSTSPKVSSIFDIGEGGLEFAKFLSSHFGVYGSFNYTFEDPMKDLDIPDFLSGDETEIEIGLHRNTIAVGGIAKFEFGRLMLTPMIGFGGERQSGTQSVTTNNMYHVNIGGPRWVPIVTPSVRLI